MRLFRSSIAAATMLIAACSQPVTVPAAESTDAPSPVTPAAAPTTAAAIPERFRGVWDNAEGSCNPASDLRMDIGAVSIEFYESLGTVTGVTVESLDSVVVELTMEGEGERWEITNRLALSDGGDTLTPADIRSGTEQRIPRKRCPA